MAGASIAELGLVPYHQAHRLQLDMVAARRAGSLDRDLFLCVEHPPVFTLGRRGDRSHLGISEAQLAERGIDLVAIERGGEITYHGPGQLVVYPIIDLRAARLSVSAYVERLEGLMLAVAADLGVSAGRDSRNRGIWVGNEKLGSIGIAIRHGISFHGLALNVECDLAPFSWINPCGLAGIAMTSISRQLNRSCPLASAWVRLAARLPEIFALDDLSTISARVILGAGIAQSPP